MPDKKPLDDGKEQKWITVGGKKIPVGEDEDAEEATREKLPTDTRGEKEKNTKEAKKALVKRYNVIKTRVDLRDEVVFDNFEKSGIVCGIDVGGVTIFHKGNKYNRTFSEIFKKSEMVGEYHWDVLSKSDRIDLLKASKVGESYLNNHWCQIPYNIQKALQKGAHPAGYSGSVNTSTQGVYNPVNDDKTISKRIEEKKKKRNEEKESD